MEMPVIQQDNPLFTTAPSHIMGDYISREMKLALTLRTLADGAYLDLYLWMNISHEYCIEIVKFLIREWI